MGGCAAEWSLASAPLVNDSSLETLSEDTIAERNRQTSWACRSGARAAAKEKVFVLGIYYESKHGEGMLPTGLPRLV